VSEIESVVCTEQTFHSIIINAADKNIKMNKGFLLGIFACGVEVEGAAVVFDGVPLA